MSELFLKIDFCFSAASHTFKCSVCREGFCSLEAETGIKSDLSLLPGSSEWRPEEKSTKTTRSACSAPGALSSLNASVRALLTAETPRPTLWHAHTHAPSLSPAFPTFHLITSQSEDSVGARWSAESQDTTKQGLDSARGFIGLFYCMNCSCRETTFKTSTVGAPAVKKMDQWTFRWHG